MGGHATVYVVSDRPGLMDFPVTLVNFIPITSTYEARERLAAYQGTS